MSPITLWFLQASRSIRSAWLLEELGLEYTVKFSERVNQKAPPEFKAASGNPLGKFPVLQDGELTVYESGAINDYLCETYDKTGTLLPLPSSPAQRIKVRQWIHAAEATFALHALSILYLRWNLPSSSPPSVLATAEASMSANVQNDLSWLETELSLSEGGFLCGEQLTSADVMMLFSVEFIFERDLGVREREWSGIRAWMERCKGREAWRRAVEKTGYRL